MKINDPSKAQYQGWKMHSFGRRRSARQRTSEVFLILAILLFIAALVAPGAWRMADAYSGYPPVAVDDFYTVLEDETLVVQHPGLFANDHDPEYDHFLAHYVLPSKHGTVNYIEPQQGAFSYTPNPNFNGTDTFTYRLSELGTGTPSNIAMVTITVIPVNDPPTAHDDQLRLLENSDWTNVHVLENDSSAPDTNEPFSVVALTQPTHGVAELNAGGVRYMPAAGYSGPDSFTYTVSDGNGGSDSATVDVTVAPPPAIAVRFSRADYNVTEGCVPATLTIVLDHEIASETVTVDYSITGGTASQKSDYTYAAGTLVPAIAMPEYPTTGRISFSKGDTNRQIQVLINEDGYAEGTETVTVALSNPVGVYLAEPSSAMLKIDDNDPVDSQTNPIDDPATFVCQHYHDFLHRQPDAAGLAFWTNEITMCGADVACVNEKRHNVSAAFFLAVEFQEAGYFVERLYEACLSRHPTYEEFLRDVQSLGSDVIVGVSGWQERVETNKQAFAEQFVQRAEYLRRYRVGITAEEYVNEIFEYAGTYDAWREAVDAYGSGDTRGRAAAMRKVMESESVFRRYFNGGFVLAEYFGYLRRDPSDAPDVNWSGYDFWLAKMDQYSEYYENVTDAVVAHDRIRRAQMIDAFINSREYRERFGR